ncbi:hypothetical protein [Brumimicrobium oceani]|uniref:Uncharacterized protein n=1 Tax=Brumimicrobium oceani TaxID=2100725 RepID=A0A2U2XF95_9FLAO|nr:hypothetical protein [Brumimicrobium oceani]PWH86410.1 hypothetical protein DIT68_04000 [Brumimicrobium oceani]
MSERVLAIVFTPLQYINARSYIINNNCEANSKVLIFASDSKNVKSILEIVEENSIIPFKRIAYLPIRINWILKALYLRLIFNSENYDSILIGNFNNIFAYYLGYKFSEKRKKITLVDDGFATINVYKKRNIDGNYGFGFRKSILDKIIYKILRLKKTNEIPRMNFYTHFSLPNNLIDHVLPAQKNSFYNDELIIPEKNICFFIGAPVVELDFISFDKFKSFINEIKTFYSKKGIEIIYVLHRLENEKEIDLKQQRFRKPIEIVFGNEINFLPSHVISFFSTALFTLYQIYPSINICYYDISKNIGNKTKKENVLMIYEYLSSLTSINKFTNT